MWIAENVSAAANSVQAVVALISLVLWIVINRDSGMSKASKETPADRQESATATNKTAKDRGRSNVGLFCVFIGLGNLAWLQFGPAASAPLSTGNAASIAVSLSLLGFAVMVSRS